MNDPAGTVLVITLWVAGIISTIVYLETAHGAAIRTKHPLVLAVGVIVLWPFVLAGFIVKQLWSP